MHSDARLHRLLREQRGLISRPQALALGLSDDAIRWRLGRGLWWRVCAGLYADVTGALTDDQRLTAASLVGGEHAQITGVAALRFHRVRYLPTEPRVHVLVPQNTVRRSRGFIVVSRTGRLDPHPTLRPAMDVCSPARAGADAARVGYDRRTVLAFLADLVQRQRVTLDQLDAECRAGPRRGSRLLRDVLAELGAGVRSAPEADLRQLTSGSAVLPPIRWNPVLVAADGSPLPSPDGWIENVGVVLETDSVEFHTSLEDWGRTRRRHNRYAACGILTLHFSPRDIRRDAAGVLALIERVYLERPPGFAGARAMEEGSSVL